MTRKLVNKQNIQYLIFHQYYFGDTPNTSDIANQTVSPDKATPTAVEAHRGN